MKGARNWRVAFERLLKPRLVQALKDDACGRTPLKSPQRRQIKSMLEIVMTPAEIRKALGVRARKRKPSGA